MKIETARKTNGVKPQVGKVEIKIKPPNFMALRSKLTGTAPLVINKFSQKAREQIKATQEAGRQAKSKKVREPKDFEAIYQGAFYVAKEGWYGLPAAGFRNAMITACVLSDFFKSRAKLAIFIEADGFDRDDGMPLVKVKGTPHKHECYGRNSDGSVDIRVRPMWDEWTVDLTVKFDGDMFSIEDITNLLMRAGAQVGYGEGRPASKNSNGLGWGTWKINQ